jgi:hypothetical protein
LGGAGCVTIIVHLWIAQSASTPKYSHRGPLAESDLRFLALLPHTQQLLIELCLSSFRLAAPRSIHDLRETPWTVGVSKQAIGRIPAMYVSILPLRDPALIIKKKVPCRLVTIRTYNRRAPGPSLSWNRRGLHALSERIVFPQPYSTSMVYSAIYSQTF